jgi:hypothetical protein
VAHPPFFEECEVLTFRMSLEVCSSRELHLRQSCIEIAHKSSKIFLLSAPLFPCFEFNLLEKYVSDSLEPLPHDNVSDIPTKTRASLSQSPESLPKMRWSGRCRRSIEGICTAGRNLLC